MNRLSRFSALAAAGVLAVAIVPASAQVAFDPLYKNPGYDPYYVQRLDPFYGDKAISKTEFLAGMGKLYDMNMAQMKKVSAPGVMKGEAMTPAGVRAMLREFGYNAFGYDTDYGLNPNGRTVPQTAARATDSPGFRSPETDLWPGMESVSRAQFLDGMSKLYDRTMDAAKKGGGTEMRTGSEMTRKGLGRMIQQYLTGTIPGS
jgi:hypothetical protein